jgi:hypothetical protein
MVNHMSFQSSMIVAIIAAALFIGAGASVRSDDNASPAPQKPNQMQMDRDTTDPKANVVGVKPIPAGPQMGHGGLDPSNGSSAGFGVQIPLGGSDSGAQKGATGPSKDPSEQNDERDSE